MANILVISYHFPPEEGSCSDKNVKIVNTLLEYGHEITVLTKKGDKPFDENNDRYKVIYINSGKFHRHQRCSVNEDVITINDNSNNLKKRVKEYLSLIIIPDAAIDWYLEVMKWCKNNNDAIKKFDMIFSISSPYSAHIISYNLSKKYNKPLVCCYGDPWIYEPKRKRNKLRYSIEKSIENKILTHASKVLVITEYNKNKYLELYKLNSDAVLTYNIGYDESKVLHKDNGKKNNIVNLIYGGSLNSVHRNPSPFLDALEQCRSIPIKVSIYNEDFVDLKNQVEQRKLTDKVDVLKLIPNIYFNEKLFETDVLLLFGNKTPFQVPGKLFDFMSTGTHILYIKNNTFENDATQMILEDYQNATIIHNNVGEITKALLKIQESFINNQLNCNCYKENYEYHKTMQPILDAVNKVLMK